MKKKKLVQLNSGIFFLEGSYIILFWPVSDQCCDYIETIILARQISELVSI